jgi:hypothetical protein
VLAFLNPIVGNFSETTVDSCCPYSEARCWLFCSVESLDLVDCSYFSTVWEADLVDVTSATFVSESGSDDGRIPDFPCTSGG